MTALNSISGRHPILSSATLDYRDGCEYRARHERRGGDQSFYFVRHTVTGVNCLIKELLLHGHARAMCTVVAPWAMYRKAFIAEESPSGSPTSEVQVEQKLPIRTDEFEPPVKMQPSIVIVAPPPCIVLGEEHGVDDLWYGAEAVFEKGAILTDHAWWETQLGESILRVVKANEGEIPEGSFKVDPVAEQGFYFRMKVSPELYRPMHHPGSEAANAHVRSLYAAAFAQGLVQLRKGYQDPIEWQNFSNLRSLHVHLKQRNLPTWDENLDDVSFWSNRVAAAIAPHVIPNSPDLDLEQDILGQ